jgi:uncharacterized membrane protein
MGDCPQSGIYLTQILLPGLSYLFVLVVLAMMNKRDFLRCPEKRLRYKALPVHYKLLCWFVVTPFFVASVFVHAALFFIAIVLYIGLEIACVSWYRKNGFWN